MSAMKPPNLGHVLIFLIKKILHLKINVKISVNALNLDIGHDQYRN